MWVGAISSEKFSSFMFSVGGGGILHCLLPRFDSDIFVEKTLSLFNTESVFNAVDIESQNIKIKVISAGLSLIFECEDLHKNQKFQFSLESNMCKSMLQKLKNSNDSVTNHYGKANPFKIAWNFEVVNHENEEKSE